MSDTKYLKGLSKERRIAIWHELNYWGWPKEIPTPEKRTVGLGANPRRNELLTYLMRQIGKRKIMEGMPDGR